MSQDSDWDEPTWTSFEMDTESFLPNSIFLMRTVHHYIKTNQPQAMVKCLSNLTPKQLQFFMNEYKAYFSKNDSECNEEIELDYELKEIEDLIHDIDLS